MAATHSLSLVAASSQYATINDASSPNIDITGSQTWEMWVNLAALSTQYYIAGIRASGGGNLKGFWCDASNSFYFSLSGLTTNESATKQLTNTANVWFHVAGVYNGSTIKLYLNGEEVDSRTATGTTAAITAGFSIGRLGDQGASYFGGKVRNFRIWSVARTQQEIRDNMNIDTPVGTGLQGNWILNNAYTDSSGNGYTLTASGSPTFSTTYPDAIDLVENTNWTANKKLTLNVSSLSLSGDLTDVPVPLTESIFSTAVKDAIFAAAKSDGSDVRFSTDIDGKIRLAHELVSWDNSGKTMEIHLKLNSLDVDADNTIYMHYGNSGASALNENEAFGKHQANIMYLAKYNLSDTVDSSKNSYDLTNNNTVAFNAAKIGLGADGGSANTNKSLNTTSLMGLGVNSARSVLVWVKMNTEHSGADKYQYFASSGHAAEDRAYFLAYFRISSVNKVYYSHGRAGGVGNDIVETVNLGTDWHQLAITFDGNNITGYRNAVSKGTAAVTKTNGPVSSFIDGFRLLGGQDGSGMISSIIDNAMIFNSAISADYIKALYNLQNDPAGFIEVVDSSFTPFFFFLT